MPDQVADAVWGEHPPSSWPTQVQICVGRLRKVFGAAAIETMAGGYRLTSGRRRGRCATGSSSSSRVGGRWRRRASRIGRPPTFDQGVGVVAGPSVRGAVDGWEPALSARRPGCEELRRSAEEESARCPVGRRRTPRGRRGGRGAGGGRAVAGAALGDPRPGAVPLRPSGRRVADAGSGAAGCWSSSWAIDPEPSWSSWRRRSFARTRRWSRPSSPSAATGECPYKGLAAYDVADADMFFGRDDEVGDLPGAVAVDAGAGGGRPVGVRQVVAGARRAGFRPWPADAIGGGDRAR